MSSPATASVMSRFLRERDPKAAEGGVAGRKRDGGGSDHAAGAAAAGMMRMERCALRCCCLPTCGVAALQRSWAGAVGETATPWAAPLWAGTILIRFWYESAFCRWPDSG